MKLNVNGLIIRESPIGERDKTVVLLTAEKGLIHAFATGAMSVKGKNSAAVQLFCFGKYTVNNIKGTNRISESEPLEMFYELRSDIERLSLAQYFCEICAALAPEQDEAPEYLKLMLNTLKFLNDGVYSPAHLKPLCELRMLALSGYMPDIEHCSLCGNTSSDNMLFSLSEGTLICRNHVASGKIISSSVLSAMRYILFSDLKDSYNFRLSDESYSQLGYITSKFLTTQLERSFKTLDFYNSLTHL